MYEDYIYHTLAAKASGELCLKYIFSFGAFARKPLLQWLASCFLYLSTYGQLFSDSDHGQYSNWFLKVMELVHFANNI